MSEERAIGSIFIFSGDGEPCEWPDCDERSKVGVWDGGTWRRICEEHERAFKQELRKQPYDDK
jgi:hypothetical protein